MKKIISFLLCMAMLSSVTGAFAEATPESTTEPTESTAIIGSADEPTNIIVTETSSEMPAESEAPTADTASEAPVEATTNEPTESEEATETPTINPDLLANQVNVNVTVMQLPFMVPSEAKFELYNSDNELLASQTQQITGAGQKLTYTFDVPDYRIGDTFRLKPADGLMCVQYYEKMYDVGNEFAFNTYYYHDENGTLHTSNTIDITVVPYFEKAVNIKYNGQTVPLTPSARVIDGVTMVPLRQLAEYAGLNVSYDERFNSVAVSLGNEYMFFNVGNDYTTVFGTDLYAPYPTTNIDGTVYVPLRTFADGIGSSLTVNDSFYTLDVDMGISSKCSAYFDTIPVNQWGISSRTNYMVWVSLSEYKVRLYKGRQKQWKPIHEATCAIGAPGTPTVTGSFEYNYKTRWDYGTYYVGPCLVFYRGYALHSVLLNQNGTEYDGRTGVMISHGCIRLKKKDIDFIANTIPVGTRIYITP